MTIQNIGLLSDSNCFFAECQVGFNSEKKLTCKKCTEGNYGEKCGKTCKCNSNEWYASYVFILCFIVTAWYILYSVFGMR